MYESAKRRQSRKRIFRGKARAKKEACTKKEVPGLKSTIERFIGKLKI